MAMAVEEAFPAMVDDDLEAGARLGRASAEAGLDELEATCAVAAVSEIDGTDGEALVDVAGEFGTSPGASAGAGPAGAAVGSMGALGRGLGVEVLPEVGRRRGRARLGGARLSKTLMALIRAGSRRDERSVPEARASNSRLRERLGVEGPMLSAPGRNFCLAICGWFVSS